MLPPQQDHLLNGDTLRLWQEQVHKDGHDGDPPRKEQEYSVLKVTQ